MKEAKDIKKINLTDSEIILLCELITLCNIPIDGMTWAIPSKEYLCEKLSMSKPTVYRCLKSLEDKKLIYRKRVVYKGRRADGICVAETKIKNYVKYFDGGGYFDNSHFIKVPYIYLKAFK